MKYCTCNRRRNPRKRRRHESDPAERDYFTRLTEGFEALSEDEPEDTRSKQLFEARDLARPFVGRRPADTSYLPAPTPPLASSGMQGAFTGSPRATRAFPDAPGTGRPGRWPRRVERDLVGEEAPWDLVGEEVREPERTGLHSDPRFSRGYSGWRRRRRNRRFRYNPCSSDHKRRPRRFNPEFNVTPTIFDHADDRSGVGRRWGGVTFKRSRSTDREPDVWDSAVEDYEAEWGKGSLGGSRRRLRRRNPGFDSPFSPIYKHNPG